MQSDKRVLILTQTEKEYDECEGKDIDLFKIKPYVFDDREFRLMGVYPSPLTGKLRGFMKFNYVHALISVDPAKMGEEGYREAIRESLEIAGELPVTFTAKKPEKGQSEDYSGLVDTLTTISGLNPIDLVEGETSNLAIEYAMEGIYEGLAG